MANDKQIKEKKTEKKNIAPLIYPSDLSRYGGSDGLPNSPYIQFTAYQWNVRTGLKKNQSIFITNTSRGTVMLPLSDDALKDDQGINWSTSEGVGANNLVDFGFKTGLDFLRGIGGNFSKFFEFRTGQTVNDMQSLAFGLTNFRTFSFSFKFVPKSSADSLRLAQIVQFFKQESIADFLGATIDYPSMWKIEVYFPSGDRGDLFKKLLVFKTCVCSFVSLNYNPEGAGTFFHDGAPTIMSLDLQFQELERLSRYEINLGLT